MSNTPGSASVDQKPATPATPQQNQSNPPKPVEKVNNKPSEQHK